MNSDLLWLAGPLALGYALLFWSVSLRVPCVPLVMIFGLAPFQNDISGLGWLHFSLSEVHLLLAAPLLLMRGWRGQLGWLGPTLWGGMILTFLITVPNWRDSSAVSLIQMGLYWIGSVAVFSQLPRSRNDFDAAWKSLIIVGCLLAMGALVNRSSYFWGLNKNGVGASLSCALIVTVECWAAVPARKKKRYLAALLLIAAGLILVLSRGAWLAAMVGVAFLLAWRGQYKRLFQLGCSLVPVVAAVWMVLPKESKEYATSFDSGRYNIKARELNTEWAQEQWRSSPILGVGAGLRKEYDATNALWLTLAETGPLGLICFVAVHARVVGGAWRRRKKENMLLVSPVSLAGALVLAKFAHGMVDHYWSRGAIMIAWASVGMALFSEKAGTQPPNPKTTRRARSKEAGHLLCRY